MHKSLMQGTSEDKLLIYLTRHHALHVVLTTSPRLIMGIQTQFQKLAAAFVAVACIGARSATGTAVDVALEASFNSPPYLLELL